MITKEISQSGIKDVGDVNWGSHLCFFYYSKRDLVDLLIPFFKKGLENKECCIWITSNMIDEQEAKNCIEKSIEDFKQKFPIFDNENITFIRSEDPFHSKFVIIDTTYIWITSCNLLSYWYDQTSPEEIICELMGGKVVKELFEYVRSKLIRKEKPLSWIDNITQTHVKASEKVGVFLLRKGLAAPSLTCSYPPKRRWWAYSPQKHGYRGQFPRASYVVPIPAWRRYRDFVEQVAHGSRMPGLQPVSMERAKGL